MSKQTAISNINRMIREGRASAPQVSPTDWIDERLQQIDRQEAQRQQEEEWQRQQEEQRKRQQAIFQATQNQGVQDMMRDYADASQTIRMAEAAPTKTNLFPVMTPEEKQQTEQARRETRAQLAGNEAERLSLPGVGSTSPTAWMTTDPADTQRYWQLTRENQELNRQAEDMTTRLNKSEIGSWKQEQGKQYEGIRDNEDYAALSQPDESKTIKGLTLARTTGNLSIYNYINNLDGYADRMKKGPDRGEPLRKYDFLTAKERADYNYVTKNQGLAAGKAYLEYLEYDLNARMTQAVEQEARARASASPVGASALSVAQNLAAGAGIVSGVAQGVQKVFTGKPVDYNTAAFLPSRMSTATREQVAADIEKKHPNATVAGVNVLSFLYQTGMSMADSGVIAALTAVGIPGAVSLLGGSAATSAALDVKERGGSDLQALSYGLAAGFAEGLFEEVSLEKIIHPKTADGLRGLFKNALGQLVTEGSEEVFTSLANTLTDAVINGNKSELLSNQRKLMMENPSMTEEEARQQAWNDWIVSLAADFLAGAISGFFMGGGASTINFMTETNLRKAGQAMRQMGVTNTDVQDAILTAMNGAQAKQDRAWLSDMADRAARGEDLAGTLPLADLGRVFMLRSELGPNQISEQAYQRAAQNAARPYLNEEAAPAQNAATEDAGEVQGNTATAPTQEMAQRGAEEATEAAPATRGTAPLRYALNKIRNGEDVSGNDVRAIMDDEQAMQTLWDSGMLPDTIRPGAEGRQQVQQAVQRMAEQGINDRSGLRIGAAEALTQEASDEYTEEARPLALPTRDDQARDLRDELRSELTPLLTGSQEDMTNAMTALYERSEVTDALRGAGLLTQEDIDNKTPGAMLRAAVNYARGVANNGQGQERAPAADAGGQREQAGTGASASDAGGQRGADETRSREPGRSRTGGGSQRKNRVGTGGQSFSERVEQIRGSWQRQEDAGRLRRALDPFRDGEGVSTASLGISNGTDKAGIYIIPDQTDARTEKELASFREAQREMAGRGVRVVPFLGSLEMTEKDGSTYRARGAISEDGKTIWVQMDHASLTWQQILAHEDFHERVKNDKQLLRDVAAAFDRDFTEEERKAIINDYFDTYGYYNVSEEYVMEEVLADYFAGIDVYAGTENAQRDLEARSRSVREAVGSRGEARSEAASGEARASREEGKDFTEDKYFSRQIDQWNNLKDGARIKVGVVGKGSALNRVGLPAERLFFDVGKIKAAMEKHNDHLSPETLKSIPSMLNDPVVITEYQGAKNTVSVYGDIFVNDVPVVVGIVMRKDISGINVVNAIRTIHARSNLSKQITDASILYLNEDEKRTRKWFHVCGISNVPLNGTKFGLIRKIAYTEGKVKFSREADTAYMAAVERGDMETAQKMVDEAARKAGYTIKAYHGTPNRFNVFLKSRIGSTTDYGWFGRGFYFTTKKSVADVYKGYLPDSNVIEAYLNVQNPFVFSDYPGADDLSTGEIMEKVLGREYGTGGELTEDDKVRRSEDFTEWLKQNKYDGVEVFSQIMILDSEQAKRTDPVTYDNKGKVIPLSKRFNRKEPDIRYSRDIPGETEELRQENEALKERLAYWQSQVKPSDRTQPREEDVRRVARSVLKDYESGADREAVTAALRELAHTVMSEDVRWTDVRDQATRLAGTIIEAARTLAGGDEAKLHREIRAAIRSGKISFSGQADIPDYNQWRRKNFGKLTIAKDGVPVETRWQELQDAYGKGYFPDDITNPTDQVLYLAELWDRLRDVYENPYSADLAEATQYLANELIDRVLSEEVRQAPTTYADRAETRIAREALKGELRVQKVKALLDAERERRREQVANVKEHYKAKEAKGRESRKARELRTKITKRARKMTEELLRPTDKRHVPERLRRGVAAMLSAIDLGSGYSIVYDRNGNYSRVERGLELGAEETRRTQAFLAVRDALLKEADGLVMDPELLGTVEEPGSLTRLVTDLADTPIANMNSEELQVVYDALRGVEAAVRSANRMLSQARWGAVSEAADALRSDNAGKAAPLELAGYPGRVQGLTRLDMLTPEGYFHRLGKAGQAVFKMLRGAQDAFITNMADATAATREIIGKMDTAALEKEKHTVKMGGEEVTMTTAQIMELYCLMQRDQGMQHITTGGILIEPVRKGARQTTQTEPLHPSLVDLANTVKLLTAEQIRVADALQQYLSVDMAELGNEATLAVYGYKKFGQEEKYWKIRSNRNELQQTIEKETQTTSVANRGFTKAVNPRADTSVKIGSIFDTYSQSINDMATYAAWLAVGEDVNRIRNYVWRNEGGHRNGTVKGILDRVIGSGGASYLQRLLADIANGAGMDDAGLTSGFVGAYKAAAIGANIRVIIQQPTAILRALEMIDPKYFLGFRRPMKAFERAKKYSPIAQWKDWGYFDINTGRKMKDVLFENPSALEKWRQRSMWLAGKADSFAWGALWAAVEAETKDKTDLTPGTEAFYRACTERFNDIIDHTQVVDGILQRSQIMRSKDGITRMAVSFMGEPTKQYNQFMSVVYDVQHSTDPAEKKAAKQQMARTVFSMLAAGIANVLAQSIIDALRDEDRETKYWEKLLRKFLGYNPEDDTFGERWHTFWRSNMGELFNPASYLPYAKDIVSIYQGYSVERMDMEGISDTIRAFDRAYRALAGTGTQTVGYSLVKLAEQAAKLLGISLYNLDRDLTSLFATIANDAEMPVLQYYLNRYRYKPLESGNLSASLKNILWDAKQKDDGSYDIIVGKLIKDGHTQEIIDKAMLDKLENESGYTAAVKAADAAGNANKSYDVREKLTALQSLTIPEDERDQIMADQLSENQYENFHALMDAGMSYDEVTRVYMKYSEIDADKDLATSEKPETFALWVDKQPYTAEQKSLIKERLNYRLSMPLEASRYENLTGAGLSPDEAYDLDRELGALEPLPGKKSVSDAQRYDVILASNLSEKQKLAAIGTVMGTDMKTESGNPSQWAKVNAAVDAGLKLDAVMGMVREDTLDYFTKYREAGLGANDSMNLAKAIKALTPEEGKSQVSDLQKWQAAIRTVSGQFNQDKALRALMDDSAEAKYDAAYSAGINPDVYVKYKADTKDFSSDYDANGKEIKGQTKKDKFMSYIDGLNLTNPQKDALYYASGYSESTLEKDAPWHNGGGGGGGGVYARATTPTLRLPTVEDFDDEPVRGLRLPRRDERSR